MDIMLDIHIQLHSKIFNIKFAYKLFMIISSSFYSFEQFKVHCCIHLIFCLITSTLTWSQYTVPKSTVTRTKSLTRYQEIRWYLILIKKIKDLLELWFKRWTKLITLYTITFFCLNWLEQLPASIRRK